MPTPIEFEAWIQAVAINSDRRAFAALFAHFAPRVKSFLMRAGSDSHLAEELAQETMVTVWRTAHLFDPRRAGVPTWIFRAIVRQRRSTWLVAHRCSVRAPVG